MRRWFMMFTSTIAIVVVLFMESISTTTADDNWKVDDRCLGKGKGRATGKSTIDIIDNGIHDNEQRKLNGQNKKTTTTAKILNTNDNAIEIFRNESSVRQEVQQWQYHDRGNDEIFMMKLYWEEGYCWQKEWNEREWCMQCEGTRCDVGDAMILRRCDDTIAHQKLEWINQDSSGLRGRLKLAYYDLCLTLDGYYFLLTECNDQIDEQVLIRSSLSDIFELYPRDQQNSTCMNNHHHPKEYEYIDAIKCKLARNARTSKWEIYLPTTNQQEIDSIDSAKRAINLRYEDCTVQNPCAECYGDCNTDDECGDGLACYQRTDDNFIPGCVGVGSTGKDYCFRVQTDILRLRLPFCTVASPCTICQGDCNKDAHCQEGLKCFQRSSNESIPGCSDVGAIDGYDYCHFSFVF